MIPVLVLLPAPLKVSGLGGLVPPVVLLETGPDPDPDFVRLPEPLPLPELEPFPFPRPVPLPEKPVPLPEPMLDELLELDEEGSLLEPVEEAVEFLPVVDVELRETKTPPVT